MHVHLTDVARAPVAIGLVHEAVGGAGIVRRLRRQRGGGYNIASSRAYTAGGQQ